MAFERPSIQQIYQRVRGDLDAAAVGASSWLRRQLGDVIARMLTGVSHSLHGEIDYLARNLLPTTEDAEILAHWALTYGVPRLGATAAGGPVQFEGAESAVVPAGTVLTSGTGDDYTLDSDVVLEDGTGVGSVTASTVGATGNVAAGESMSLSTPIAGVQSSAVVGAPGITGGTEQESVSAWGSRIRDRIQRPPQGGSISDYERWARDAHPAVTHVWVTAHEGGDAGVVTVRIATYDHPDGDLPPVDGPVIQAVYNHIDTERPVAGGLRVIPPVAQPVHMTLAVRPDTASVRSAVHQALSALFRRSARPGAFISGQAELAGTISITHVHEAISLAPGEDDHQIQAITALAPETPGRILVLGDVTFSEWQS